MLTKRKISGVFTLSALALLAFSAIAIRPAFALPPPSPFTQCPPVGADKTGCHLLIVINADTSVSIFASSTDTLPFDGIEDSLVGVQDNCVTCGPVSSMAISGSGIFGLDGDGACAGGYSPAPPAADCTGSVTGYDTASVKFTILTSDSGVLHFTPSLNNGDHAWFSLELDLSASSITVGPPNQGVPEFNVPAFFVTAISLAVLGVFMRLRRPSAVTRQP